MEEKIKLVCLARVTLTTVALVLSRLAYVASF